MKELDIVQQTKGLPATRESILAELRELGVQPGMILIVHSSLSSIGWVCGRETALVQALEDSVGNTGTLVMASQTVELSDPAEWTNPPVPEHWWPVIREKMPPFDPVTTPAKGMGAAVEYFRTSPGTLRSRHPQDSFVAKGPDAEWLLEKHELDFGLGEGSPLARLYEKGAYVLLLGVNHDHNTSIHLAEYRASYPSKKEVQRGAPVTCNGKREWVTFRDIDLNTDDFIQIGSGFEKETGQLRRGLVGNANVMLMPQRPLVDYAVRWMEKHRP